LTIADTFERFDLDKNGSLCIDELKLLHAELVDCELVTGDVDTLLRAIDMDGDGHVQFNELVRYLERAFVTEHEKSAEDVAIKSSSAAAAATAAAATARAAAPAAPASTVHVAAAPVAAAPAAVAAPVAAAAAQYNDPASKSYSYEQLKAGPIDGVDPIGKELYLEDTVFLELFGMDKVTFAAQPKWKKDTQKKKISLF
jgi:hypothetical protein